MKALGFSLEAMCLDVYCVYLGRTQVAHNPHTRVRGGQGLSGFWKGAIYSGSQYRSLRIRPIRGVEEYRSPQMSMQIPASAAAVLRSSRPTLQPLRNPKTNAPKVV